MTIEKTYNVGIYCRLSNDDERTVVTQAGFLCSLIINASNRLVEICALYSLGPGGTLLAGGLLVSA